MAFRLGISLATGLALTLALLWGSGAWGNGTDAVGEHVLTGTLAYWGIQLSRTPMAAITISWQIRQRVTPKCPVRGAVQPHDGI